MTTIYLYTKGREEGYQFGILAGKLELLLEDNYSIEEIAAKLHITENEVNRVMEQLKLAVPG